jgi:hypothetical protein
MAEREHVLVIHGVNTRDEQTFIDKVSALNAAVGSRWLFTPVFWGDLAPRTPDVHALCPPVEGPRNYQDLLASHALSDAFYTTWAAGMSWYDAANAEAIRRKGAEETARLFTQYLHGTLQPLRAAITNWFSLFVCDVLAYHTPERRRRIHDRVLEVVARLPDGLGTRPDRPVSVVSHSLAGLIVLDLCRTEPPALWVKSLVTLGTQVSFFAAAGLLGGSAEPPVPGVPIRLPATIRDWTNAYCPFDPLAFPVATGFELADGRAPKDEPVWNTGIPMDPHGSYWADAQTHDVIRGGLG